MRTAGDRLGKAIVTLLLATAGVLASGGPAPTAALADGWGPDFRRNYVGLVAFYDDDGVYSHRCSGALVSDTVFVTAGQCTDGASQARVWFFGVIGADANPDTGFDRATGYPTQCLDATFCVTSDVLFNYGFAGLASFPDTRDIGVVVLPQPPTGVTGRARLPAAGVLDPLGVGPERNRTEFTVSGYGAAGPDPMDDLTARVTASARITGLRSALNDGFNLQSDGSGPGFGGSCRGVPGAPVFLGNGDSDTVVAVTSFGLDGWCRGTDLSYRIDRPAVLDWIDGGYLASAPEPAG